MARSFVAAYLKPLWIGVLTATLLSALLGVLGAVIGALVGPCLQVLSAAATETLGFEAMFGPRIGAWISGWLNRPGLPAGELLRLLPWALASLALVRAAMTLCQWFLWERAGEVVAMRVRDDLAGAFLSLKPDYRRMEEARSVEGALSSAITTDVRLMREYIVHFFGGLPRELLQIAFLMTMLILLSPKLTAIFLIGVLPAGAAASRIGKKLRKRAARALADYSDLSEWLQQRLLGVETIKHYRTESIEIAKMHGQSDALFQRFLQAARVKARTSPMLEAFAVVSMVVVLGVALHDVNAGTTTGAVQLSFFSTLALLSQSAGKLGRYLNSNREGAAAVDRLRASLDFFAPRAAGDVTRPVKDGAPRIVFRDLRARYPGSDKAALVGVSANLEGGKIYCIAGPSGAGKSTLFNSILGLIEPEAGVLELSAPAQRGSLAVCYMPQKVTLVPDSVSANVAYPDVAWDDERVREALQKVDMLGPVDKLPHGVATAVGEGGHGMSGGQAQRILLARLWYRRAPIVLVDEGTSALDPEVERTVHALLRDIARAGAVVVTIAHRPTSAEIADELLLLADGKIVASGTPREIMASATYRELLR